MTLLETKPRAYWFGVSYESDLKFAERLRGKLKRHYLEAIEKAYQK